MLENLFRLRGRRKTRRGENGGGGGSVSFFFFFFAVKFENLSKKIATLIVFCFSTYVPQLKVQFNFCPECFLFCLHAK